MSRWLIALAVVLAPGTVWGYPQFIAKSYTNCGTCHHNPTGGGLLNSYGALTVEAVSSVLLASPAGMANAST